MSQGYLHNPYEAGRNISGRWGRVFRGGDWMATVTEVSYSVEIDKMEVRRSGTRWVDYKEGEYTGTGSLSLDKVNSDYEREVISFLNGVNVDGTALTSRALRVWTLQINLEDSGIPGITYDDNGNATAGHESVSLHGVKCWNLEGGYSVSDMVNRSIEFTFNGISLDQYIVDPVDPQTP